MAARVSSDTVPAAPATLRLDKAPAVPVTLRLRAAPRPAPEPLWVATTWDVAKHEITSYLRTAWAFGVRPQATARAWAERRFQALNPLAYLLNSLAIVGPWRALWQRILHVPDTSFTSDLTNAVTPFVGVLAFGSLHHVLFRLLGTKRHVQSSWAMSIYTTGGLPTVLGLAITPFALRSQHDLLPLLLHSAVTVVSLFMQNAALAGLYGTSRRRAAGVQVASAMLFFIAVAVIVTQLEVVGTLLKLLARLL